MDEIRANRSADAAAALSWRGRRRRTVETKASTDANAGQSRAVLSLEAVRMRAVG